MYDEKQFSVMIVDDELHVRELIEDMLLETSMFKSIIHACDGQEAWAKLQNQEFDLIILDINMPRMDGHRFIEMLHKTKRFSKTKILVSSGHLDSVGVKQIVEQDVKSFVIKPYSEETFMEKVVNLMMKAKVKSVA